MTAELPDWEVAQIRAAIERERVELHAAFDGAVLGFSRSVDWRRAQDAEHAANRLCRFYGGTGSTERKKAVEWEAIRNQWDELGCLLAAVESFVGKSATTRTRMG